MKGIVTIDDAVDVVQEEATEDFQKVGGMQALDQPYLQTGLWEMVKKRAGWLSVLFIGEMLTASAMGFFENEIASAVVLALFVPLIISSGGNAGSQAATLIIRAMALGEVRFADALADRTARAGDRAPARPHPLRAGNPADHHLAKPSSAYLRRPWLGNRRHRRHQPDRRGRLGHPGRSRPADHHRPPGLRPPPAPPLPSSPPWSTSFGLVIYFTVAQRQANNERRGEGSARWPHISRVSRNEA